jgi:hypothetical protein
MGDVPAAVDDYRDIPPAVRARLKDRMRRFDYDDLVMIRRDRIEGRAPYAPEIRSMHFGEGRMCTSVTRHSWPARHEEQALVYCESGQCVMVPTVCRNVSRIERLPPTVASNAPPQSQPPTGELEFEPPAAGWPPGTQPPEDPRPPDAPPVRTPPAGGLLPPPDLVPPLVLVPPEASPPQAPPSSQGSPPAASPPSPGLPPIVVPPTDAPPDTPPELPPATPPLQPPDIPPPGLPPAPPWAPPGIPPVPPPVYPPVATPPAPVPEPGTLGLTVLGLMAISLALQLPTRCRARRRRGPTT